MTTWEDPNGWEEPRPYPAPLANPYLGGLNTDPPPDPPEDRDDG